MVLVARRARRRAQVVGIGGVLLVGFGFTPSIRAQVSPGPLARVHQQLEGNRKCLDCHGGGDESIDQKCVECHREIGWYLERGSGLHGQLGEASCTTCHPDHGGRDFALVEWEEGSAKAFDHGRTGWRLTGAHRAASCDACHRADRRTGPAATLAERARPGASWLGLETTCGSCHADYHEGVLGDDCQRCHATSRWDSVAGFDHDESRFPLTGKHVEVGCRSCHPLGEGADPRPQLRPVAHVECSDCHTDTHRGRLGANCSSCHVAAGFDLVEREAFDHVRTAFPLRGRHANVRCESCHRQDDFTADLEHATCGSCHADVHAGQATRDGRPADCTECHDERAFQPSTFVVERHASTRYPLVGKHALVACRDCHAAAQMPESNESVGSAGIVMRPPHAACAVCHDDAHGGQLAHRDDGTACESCHDVEGWRPSTFEAERHATLALPLDGRHATIDCAACHGPRRVGLPDWAEPARLGSAGVGLTLLSGDCASCHRDPHRDSGGNPHGNPDDDSRTSSGRTIVEAGCRECHDTLAFAPSSIDVAAHEAFAYPLEGAHRTVPCLACHVELQEPAVTSTLVAASGPARALRFVAATTCEACHRSPHCDQFDYRAGGSACTTCHGTGTFRPATGFDHGRDASFRLDGKHLTVACASCHPNADDGAVVYRPVPRRCQDCHAAADRTAWARMGGT